MYIWTLYKVNYVFIFDFDNRVHFRYQNMLEVLHFPYIESDRYKAAALFTLVWLISFFAYLVSYLPESPAFLTAIPYAVHPLILLCISLIVTLWFQIEVKINVKKQRCLNKTEQILVV